MNQMPGGGVEKGEKVKKISIKILKLQNFKGCKDDFYAFSDRTVIHGANATGKTTIFDAFTWLFFDRDSLGRQKFNIRPMDVHGVDIVVEAVISVDEKTYTLRKVQSEVWRKKRGSAVAELQGNKNEYWIDGYPKTEKEYKDFICELVDDEKFKLLTNPNYFTGLKWQDQRKILVDMVGNFTDIELALADARFAPLVDELERASTDDIKKKYQRQLAEFKRKADELPVRIDEAHKSIVTVDVEALKKERDEIVKQLAENRQAQADLSKATDKSETLYKIAEAKQRMNELKHHWQTFLDNQRYEHRSAIHKIYDDINSLKSDMTIYERKIASSEPQMLLEQLKSLRDEWTKVNDMQFDENDLNCPYCGQELPESKRLAMIAEFEDNKKRKLANITARGNRLNSDYKQALEDVNDAREKYVNAKALLDVKQGDAKTLEASLQAIPATPNMNDVEEYAKLTSLVESLEAELAEQKAASNDDIIRGLRESETALDVRLSSINYQLGQARSNAIAYERIKGLETEQKDVAQKVVETEGKLFLLEEFVKEKMDAVSKAVNGKFDGVEWKLFDYQLNGGLKETCECTVNGVPYSSLNNGHRIIAGLKIIKTLQEFYGLYCPVFIDNAEAISEGNLPQMPCQTICMYVTDDERLVIE